MKSDSRLLLSFSDKNVSDSASYCRADSFPSICLIPSEDFAIRATNLQASTGQVSPLLTTYNSNELTTRQQKQNWEVKHMRNRLTQQKGDGQCFHLRSLRFQIPTPLKNPPEVGAWTEYEPITTREFIKASPPERFWQVNKLVPVPKNRNDTIIRPKRNMGRLFHLIKQKFITSIKRKHKDLAGKSKQIHLNFKISSIFFRASRNATWVYKPVINGQ